MDFQGKVCLLFRELFRMHLRFNKGGPSITKIITYSNKPVKLKDCPK